MNATAPMQTSFDFQTAPAATPREPRSAWVRLPGRSGKLDARYLHTASGWIVRHCGHATANWPYYAVDPAHPDVPTVTHNGLGFQTIDRAFSAIEKVLRGELVATDVRCGHRTRRITTHEDNVAEVPAGASWEVIL